MKTKTSLGILTIISFAFLISCSTKNDGSDAYGNFEVRKTVISAEGNGMLLQFDVEEGQKLAQGDPLGQIDTLVIFLQKEQLKAQINATLSGLKDIQAQLEVLDQQRLSLNINKERVDRLFVAKAATQKQVDDIKAQLDLIDTQKEAVKTQKIRLYDQVEVIKKQLDLLNLSSKKCQIVSPISGVVLNTLARKGEMVAVGKPLFTIANMDKLDLKVYVSGIQLTNIKVGDPVKVFIDQTETENQELSGQITWIAESAEFTPKTIQTKDERVNLVYAVKIQVENDGRLKIGMPGEAIFTSSK